MAFTQKKRININPDQIRVCIASEDFCNGCDAQCKLGYRYSPLGYHIYPTIGEKIISRYIDEKRISRFTGVVALGDRTIQQKNCIKLWAGEIACLCDHYKQR